MDCMENNHFRAIAGFTGGGKTVALRSFADRHPNAAYVEANILMNRKSFLSAICRAFGMHIDDTAEGLMNKIVDRMISEEQTVLLIDDAAKLKDDCFRLLQVIYDKTEGSAGIVIAGTEKLKKYLDRSAAKDKLSYRELKRRISFWQSLKKPTAVVIKKVAEVYEIVDKDVIQWLAKEVQDYGTLRNYILNALKVAVVGSNVSVAILNDLHLGDRAYRD